MQLQKILLYKIETHKYITNTGTLLGVKSN